jgi:uncharacterized protein (TIGR03089 family)
MTPAALLDAALLRDPARPLLTHYDDATGERTELSVTTYANWVAKTANLLVDSLGVQPGDRVSVRLPVHWQAAVWLGACWVAGLVVTDGHPGGPPARVAVLAADEAAGTGDAQGAEDVVSLGLAPLGLPGPVPAAPGTLDYDREVHGHGDRFVPLRPAGDGDPAYEAGGRPLTAGGLVDAARAAAADWALRAGDRVLTVRPLVDLTDVLASLLVPLAADATAVLCRHPDQARLAVRVATEAVVLGCGVAPGDVPDLRLR